MQLLPLKEWVTRRARLFGRAARALDRAIRRIEDRHRGPLPYMRRRADHAEDTAFSSRNALRALAETAPGASVSALAALRSLESEGTADPANSHRLKVMADELSILAAAYCEVGLEARQPDAMRGRSEPIWATGLSRRFDRFVSSAEECSSPAASSGAPARAAVRPSQPRQLRPPQPDLP